MTAGREDRIKSGTFAPTTRHTYRRMPGATKRDGEKHTETQVAGFGGGCAHVADTGVRGAS